MDKSTIIGIVAAIVLGFIFYKLTIRHRYQGRITFMKEQCLGLFESIVRNFPELQVLYEGKPVSRQIVLLKGSLLNTGSKDIEPNMVELPLTVKLPNGYSWLKARVVNASPSVLAEVNIVNDLKLEFKFGLFRCKEFIRFEALAEVPIRPSWQNTKGHKCSGLACQSSLI